MKNWAAIVTFARTLPGVEEGTSYGKPAVKLRGKMLAAATAADPGSFVLHATSGEKEVLLETDPATFWETDHYRGWPAVLVRYGTGEDERVRLLLTRAWWDRATVRQRRDFDDRP